MDITQLCVPIFVSSLAVFFASFVAWMVLPHHKKDVRVLPDEKGMADFLKTADIPPGTYMWPNCQSTEEMKSDEFIARNDAGPWGSINILRAKPNFGANLLFVFMFYVVVSLFVAYITGQARHAGDAFMAIFQVAGATAILGYCAGSIPNSVFFSKPARFVFTDFLDSLVYGLLTGLIFAWLWPAAAGA